MITALLERIIDADDMPIPKPAIRQRDFKSDMEESKFKEVLSKIKVKAVIDDDERLNYRLVKIRPENFAHFKLALTEHGLLPNLFLSEQIWAVEKDDAAYFEFKSPR